ncbi:50S ribosomal protein L29 [Candidatus Daviesbacteria bacterium]|nr:50S ribosomal protein L29 [Candidatus Daviesbacteria bacterium]
MKKGEQLTEIKGLGIKELKEKVKAFDKEIDDLVMDKNMKKLKDLKMISKKKKDLARALTAIRQKELLGELEAEVSKTEVVKNKEGGSKEVKSKK